MALGRSSSFADYAQSHLSSLWTMGGQDDGLETTLCMRTMGRKRILIRNRSDVQSMDFPCEIRASKRLNLKADESLHLDMLPTDILVRVLCGVDHDDLKQLYLVSKTIKEAAMIAKSSHFAFSTPKSKQHRAKLSALDSSDFHDGASEFDDIEIPNAPLRLGKGKTSSGKKFAEISVNLFQSLSED